MKLANKVALVTGGSRGIGAAIVKRLANEGSDVAFTYLGSKDKAESLVKEIEKIGRRALAVAVDQSNASEVKSFVEQVEETFGGIDIVVNSAGVYFTGKVDDPTTDFAKMDRQLDINIKGVVNTVRAAAPIMNAGGRIVSIGTTGATHIAFPGVADYVASKAAIAAYTRGWSRDLGPRGITVNIIQPGAINTDMNPETSAHASILVGMTSLGRYGQPEEIAAAVAFLVGPEASYITGATLNVDGGQIA